jgi:hypothetical protein
VNSTPVPYSHTTARRLSALAQLYRRGEVSPLLDRTLDKVLAYEADLARAQLAQLQADLAEFEQRYHLSSDEFYRQYQAGQSDDRLDFTEWASLIQMAHNLRERLRLLAGEDPA